GRHHLDERLEELREPEVGDGAAEEHRRHLAAGQASRIEGVAGGVEQLDVIAQLPRALLLDRPLEPRRAEGARAHGGDLRAVRHELEEEHLARLAVVDPPELAANDDRPGDRVDTDPEDLLDLADEVEGIASGPIELVDEGEDWHLPHLADAEE